MRQALDAAAAWLDAGDLPTIATVEALLNADALGGLERTYAKIISMLRARGRLGAAGGALWRHQTEQAYRSYLEGYDDEGLCRRYGWSSAHIGELVQRWGLRHPRHTADDNARVHPRASTAESGWGVDARCRDLPEAVCLTDAQHAGWVWADMQLSTGQSDLYVGIPISVEMALAARSTYEGLVAEETARWRESVTRWP